MEDLTKSLRLSLFDSLKSYERAASVIPFWHTFMKKEGERGGIREGLTRN